MRRFAWGALSVLLLAAGPDKVPKPASYDVRVVSVAPPRLAVRAVLPAVEPRLDMATSRPGDVPEISSGGWGALVTEITAVGADGKPVAVTPAKSKGWTMERAGPVTVDYVVDYSLLAERGWPAAREAAFADESNAVVVGRSLFITTPGQRDSIVRFTTPEGWHAVAPWDASGRVASIQDLFENLIAFTRGGTEELSAGRFRFHVVPFGRWDQARAEVRRVIRGPVTQLVKVVGTTERASYNLVLLPIPESGGESFRSSFALTTEEAPSAANIGEWGGLFAHEFFHYWNGSRLRGTDYASSNWFQEGFTEYAANVAMLRSGLLDEAGFRAKLARHVDNYGKLRTPLDAPGDRKGPPLYSGGALVAFCWDATIREATRGERNLDDVFRALWKRTEASARPYAWRDIKASLDDVVPSDWDAFHRRYIHGGERLPLTEAFAKMGLYQTPEGDVKVDPAASKEARSRWLRFGKGV